MEEQELNLLDYWRVIWKYRLFIVLTFMVTVTITAIVSILLPKQYKATAAVLPVEIQGGSMLQVPEIASEMFPSLKKGSSTTDLVLAILKSARMHEDIVREFHLETVYKTKFHEEALKRLSQATNITTSKENVISVSVTTLNPRMAADIANYYVINLETINEELHITTAKPMVKFLDVARVPEKKFKPQIKINMLISGITSLFIGIFSSFFFEYLKKSRDLSPKNTK